MIAGVALLAADNSADGGSAVDAKPRIHPEGERLRMREILLRFAFALTLRGMRIGDNPWERELCEGPGVGYPWPSPSEEKR